MKNLLNKIALLAFFGLTNAEKPAYGKDCPPPLVLQKTAYGQKCKPCPPGTEYFEKECRVPCKPPLEWIQNPYTGKWECGKPKDKCIPPEQPVWEDATGWCCRIPIPKCELPLVPIRQPDGTYICGKPVEPKCPSPQVPTWTDRGWCCEVPVPKCEPPLIPIQKPDGSFECGKPPQIKCDPPKVLTWTNKGWCCEFVIPKCEPPLVPVAQPDGSYVCGKPPQPPKCDPPRTLRWDPKNGWCCEEPIAKCFILDNQFLLGAKYDQTKGTFTTKDGKTYTQDQLHQPNRIVDLKDYPGPPPPDKNRLSIFIQEDEEGCFNVIYVECG
ncbi:hypothetical protein CONCODRAFT_13883 [Conidiobolus coronatus NRRL 28638]|uniref:Uncharacterized protein n=1 Tax=Conidiobolus coronatus (strain ATCC 28846 / CBS 209.66 / NRRL 28638) TaxID=796925 RepID=A0A137NPZ5_CONC2|nr:hypothetical protein CONCODRAFT_13883 [Conidiobolus coronatus NRRL 28638]|eukprot:KXN64817.1 hypothetical protein CONCODRAFT_13883 [Conidiobolus coronatus NRRL 28638]